MIRMSEDTKGGVGVVVGRFQAHKLTLGHQDILNKVCQKHNRVIVLIGVNPVPSTRRNPLDYTSRSLMVSEYLRQQGSGLIFSIHPIMDNASDEIWSNNLDSFIRTISPFGKVKLYGGRDSFIPRYSGSFETVELDSVNTKSATSFREEVAATTGTTEEFRKGVIHSVYNSFPRVNPTVDIAVIRDYPRNPGVGHKEVLLGRKPGETKWRFPGGFVDKDETLEQAAIREAHEETGLVVENPRYIGSFSLKDWRVTEGNAMVTSLFVAHLIEGHATAGDDLAEVEWHLLNHTALDKVNSNHRHLMVALMDRKSGVV